MCARYNNPFYTSTISSEFIEIAFATFVGRVFVTLVDTLLVMLIISLHTITESSTIF